MTNRERSPGAADQVGNITFGLVVAELASRILNEERMEPDGHRFECGPGYDALMATVPALGEALRRAEMLGQHRNFDEADEQLRVMVERTSEEMAPEDQEALRQLVLATP